jgi:hypothetical protein
MQLTAIISLKVVDLLVFLVLLKKRADFKALLIILIS